MVDTGLSLADGNLSGYFPLAAGSAEKKLDHTQSTGPPSHGDNHAGPQQVRKKNPALPYMSSTKWTVSGGSGVSL